MHRLLTRILILATPMLIAVSSTEGQTTAVNQAPAIAVSISLQKNSIPLDQSPFVDLIVKNLTNEEVTIGIADPHVEGEKGELPMRPNAQIITDRLSPRMPRLRTVLYVTWTIPPKETSVHSYKLAHFFDLSHPGQYTVYMEVPDPSSHQMLRTNSAKFEMQSPAR